MVATRRWNRVSPASSGWKAVAITLPFRTATTRPSSSFDEDVDVRAHALDDGRADEDAVDRPIAQDGHGDVRLEAVQLPAEGVALDGDVEQRKDRLVAVDDLAREQDHAGARAEDRGALSGSAAGSAGAAPSGR